MARCICPARHIRAWVDRQGKCPIRQSDRGFLTQKSPPWSHKRVHPIDEAVLASVDRVHSIDEAVLALVDRFDPNQRPCKWEPDYPKCHATSSVYHLARPSGRTQTRRHTYTSHRTGLADADGIPPKNSRAVASSFSIHSHHCLEQHENLHRRPRLGAPRCEPPSKRDRQ